MFFTDRNEYNKYGDMHENFKSWSWFSMEYFSVILVINEPRERSTMKYIHIQALVLPADICNNTKIIKHIFPQCYSILSNFYYKVHLSRQ